MLRTLLALTIFEERNQPSTLHAASMSEDDVSFATQNISPPTPATFPPPFVGPFQIAPSGTAGGIMLMSPPSVTGLVVNRGQIQRSRLTIVQVMFDGPVLAVNYQVPGAVTFTRTGIPTSYIGTVGTVVDTSNGLIVTQGSANSLLLTFKSVHNAGIEYGSLTDGRWQLKIPPANYASPNGPNDFQLRRFYGSMTNRVSIDAFDFSLTPNFGSGKGVQPMDYDNNGTFDAVDFPKFVDTNGYSLY